MTNLIGPPTCQDVLHTKVLGWRVVGEQNDCSDLSDFEKLYQLLDESLGQVLDVLGSAQT